ncbi:DNA-3-methyladenine glycosylase 2 [Erwinia sp. CPCC 100877]|nr:DNA-3-methyladenine glycosylase 2 [Erwinia sp. CPCC 100877]
MPTLELDYTPPYDWDWMLAFLGARACEGVESVTRSRYCRSLALAGHSGLLILAPDMARCRLRVELTSGLAPVGQQVGERIARLLDLAHDPASTLAGLGPLAVNHPGLRLPGCIDPFEQAVRAVLGQLVSVAMAAKLTARVVQTFGKPLVGHPGWRLFPEARRLASLTPEQLRPLGMPLQRARAIIHIATLCAAGDFPLTRPASVEQGIRQLMALPGIGRWTASYFALRGWQAPDVFLADDYLVKRRFVGMTPAQIHRYAERWRPWRSYALLHIWHNDGWLAA